MLVIPAMGQHPIATDETHKLVLPIRLRIMVCVGEGFETPAFWEATG